MALVVAAAAAADDEQCKWTKRRVLSEYVCMLSCKYAGDCSIVCIKCQLQYEEALVTPAGCLSTSCNHPVCLYLANSSVLPPDLESGQQAHSHMPGGDLPSGFGHEIIKQQSKHVLHIARDKTRELLLTHNVLKQINDL